MKSSSICYVIPAYIHIYYTISLLLCPYYFCLYKCICIYIYICLLTESDSKNPKIDNSYSIFVFIMHSFYPLSTLHVRMFTVYVFVLLIMFVVSIIEYILTIYIYIN
ncbi:hypothetical protein Lalb_Chr11g0070991 [Lupinus albus]|uniref:Uncharacterized protein n=1 Tax=Lupinus albus TaxID=3870 RepID=A0A6A4PRU6_LUPAL|nr:hypothetical protein Lalb_Chr11g0070991 [Lupinus albus]